MEPDSKNSPSNELVPSGDMAPPSLPSVPPLPPVPPLVRGRKSPSAGAGLSTLLSVGLALFLVDAFLSFADDTFIALFDLHGLTSLRGLVSFLTLLVALLIYVLMAFLPSIPKRLFLPLTIFPVGVILGIIPFLIYCYDRIRWIAWAFSFCQVLLGIGILYWVQSGWKLQWPLVPEKLLCSAGFRWRNFFKFLLMNLLILGPAIMVYIGVCAGLAVDHFSDGFLSLRPAGLTVRVKKYVRADGHTIHLIPMIHIGDSQFYRKLSASFPTNSITLMEGVTDEKELLTNRISYKVVASQLGLAEQQNVFKPQGQVIRADVDIAEFNTNTINLLNLVMRVHAGGRLDPATIATLMRPPPPGFEKELFDDLLRKRNRHLLGAIQARLADSKTIMVPWGAAHMPEIAREIGKSGFHMAETKEYMAIRFGSSSKARNDAEEDGKAKAPK
ncbi:MAG: hypothetical protein JWM16_75 [Verrucomicrobiales bacterium]|nr:hypothetical protein [Verrucomicrobiales bacterium]